MDTSPPRGPLTRAQARAIETKVNSLLFKPHLLACETWVLPHADTLCSMRYKGGTQEEATGQGQATIGEEPQEDEERDIPKPLNTPCARGMRPRVHGLSRELSPAKGLKSPEHPVCT